MQTPSAVKTRPPKTALASATSSYVPVTIIADSTGSRVEPKPARGSSRVKPTLGPRTPRAFGSAVRQMLVLQAYRLGREWRQLQAALAIFAPRLVSAGRQQASKFLGAAATSSCNAFRLVVQLAWVLGVVLAGSLAKIRIARAVEAPLPYDVPSYLAWRRPERFQQHVSGLVPLAASAGVALLAFQVYSSSLPRLFEPLQFGSGSNSAGQSAGSHRRRRQQPTNGRSA